MMPFLLFYLLPQEKEDEVARKKKDFVFSFHLLLKGKV